MFTGIIQEIGTVKIISRKRDTAYLEVSCKQVLSDAVLGDSIAVNGVCLSIVKKGTDLLAFDVVFNTFNTTNLKRLRSGSAVNLESSLKMGDDISGHIVTGHVDRERTIRNNKKTPQGWVLDIKTQNDDQTHMIEKGSIAIDGTSLTIGDIHPGYIRIFLIPHTMQNTILSRKKSGDYVNIEFDSMGKYASKEKTATSRITKEMLNRNGFM